MLSIHVKTSVERSSKCCEQSNLALFHLLENSGFCFMQCSRNTLQKHRRFGDLEKSGTENLPPPILPRVLCFHTGRQTDGPTGDDK